MPNPEPDGGVGHAEVRSCGCLNDTGVGAVQDHSFFLHQRRNLPLFQPQIPGGVLVVDMNDAGADCKGAMAERHFRLAGRDSADLE